MAARTEDEDEDESLVQDMLRRSLISPPPKNTVGLDPGFLDRVGGRSSDIIGWRRRPQASLSPRPSAEGMLSKRLRWDSTIVPSSYCLQ